MSTLCSEVWGSLAAHVDVTLIHTSMYVTKSLKQNLYNYNRYSTTVSTGRRCTYIIFSRIVHLDCLSDEDVIYGVLARARIFTLLWEFFCVAKNKSSVSRWLAASAPAPEKARGGSTVASTRTSLKSFAKTSVESRSLPSIFEPLTAWISERLSPQL